jgi:tRNA uridine 5-carboxymethylaminomethyl modification enzyme
MIDDLVTRGVIEPYRMFTSRAEYRLSLRADNADQRLTPKGIALGLVGTRRAKAFGDRMEGLEAARAKVRSLSLTPNAAARHGLHLNHDGIRRTAFELLARPDMSLARLCAIWPELAGLDRHAAEQVEIDAKYAVYLERQADDIASFERDQAAAIPADLDFRAMAGLSNELKEKLAAMRPANLAQAARVDGMTPAALALILAGIRRSDRHAA